jgi:hypothetical protein
MPNYPTHARWGQIGAAAIGSAVAAAIYLLVLSPVLAFVAGIGAAATTFVGAIYPDIDHHKSIPRRKAVRAFQILVVLGIASLAGLGWVEVVETVEIASTEFGVELPMPAEIVAVLALAGLAAIAASLINPVIGIVTFRHRGWTHSVPINTVLVAVVLGTIWLLTHQLTFERRLTAVIVTGTFFVGTLIHLGLDGEIV